jgi:hypothetical protein
VQRRLAVDNRGVLCSVDSQEITNVDFLYQITVCVAQPTILTTRVTKKLIFSLIALLVFQSVGATNINEF